MDDFSDLWFDCEGLDTSTSKEQCQCEFSCSSFLKSLSNYPKDVLQKFKAGSLSSEDNEIMLLQHKHQLYLNGGLRTLPFAYVSLDASRPWICYWILHALYLLNQEPIHLYPHIISTLSTMQQPTGGFGGGFGQISHGAPNYAAVLSLAIIGTPEAYNIIDRPAMYNFFLSVKDKVTGGFRMHQDGEVDCRATYTILSIARLLNILTPELCIGTGEYLLSCQSFEGGFGGEPGNEAHGGYNFCAVAGLVILNRALESDLDSLEGWLVRRQMRLEGGFQGRTNKLVDSCYSFWQGAGIVMVEMVRRGMRDTLDQEGDGEGLALDLDFSSLSLEDPFSFSFSSGPSDHSLSLDKDRLNISEDGEVGDIDIDLDSHLEGEGEGGQREREGEREGVEVPDIDSEPSKQGGEELMTQTLEAGVRIFPLRLSSEGHLLFDQTSLQRYILHCAQNLEGGMRDKPGKGRDFYHSCYSLSGLSVSQWGLNIPPSHSSSPSPSSTPTPLSALPEVYGSPSNLLRPTSPVFNIGPERARNILRHFRAIDTAREKRGKGQQRQGEGTGRGTGSGSLHGWLVQTYRSRTELN